MAHLMAPQPSHPELPVFFNVDGVVGAAPAVNNREDVLLVQFIFNVIATSPRPTTDPVLLAAARAVRLTGTIDPATITAIRAHQTVDRRISGNPNQVVDGRVSPAKGGYSYGALWTIAELNNNLQDRHVNIWPRIDTIPGCPAELRQMVVRAVAGM